jgi:hypothetical protein
MAHRRARAREYPRAVVQWTAPERSLSTLADQMGAVAAALHALIEAHVMGADRPAPTALPCRCSRRARRASAKSS